MNVLITGAAGYVGSMLLDAFAGNPAVDRVIGVDLKEPPKRHATNRKVRWMQQDVACEAWNRTAHTEAVDVVVHCAYQIRQLYGTKGQELQHRWNIGGARKVLDFALSTPSVRRLIHLSTISAYGAKPTNSLQVPFAEDALLSEDTYLYGVQKRQIEVMLRNLHGASDGSTDVTILRMASLSGPYGRFVLRRYGLLSTLAGKFPTLPYGRADWCRQYLHEDDAAAIITQIAQAPQQGGALETFNAAPDTYLTARDVAQALGKRAVLVPPVMLRNAFAMLWHGTRGAIATPAGAWRFLSYPIHADGSRLRNALSYSYGYNSLAALLAQEGGYARLVRPPDLVEEPRQLPHPSRSRRH